MKIDEKPETLRKHSWVNAYGFTGEARLVKVGKKYYLVLDEWVVAGTGEYLFRAFAYSVDSKEKLTEIKFAFANPGRDIDPVQPDLGDRWEYLETVVVPGLKPKGPAKRFGWYEDLE